MSHITSKASQAKQLTSVESGISDPLGHEEPSATNLWEDRRGDTLRLELRASLKALTKLWSVETHGIFVFSVQLYSFHFELKNLSQVLALVLTGKFGFSHFG